MSKQIQKRPYLNSQGKLSFTGKKSVLTFMKDYPDFKFNAKEFLSFFSAVKHNHLFETCDEFILKTGLPLLKQIFIIARTNYSSFKNVALFIETYSKNKQFLKTFTQLLEETVENNAPLAVCLGLLFDPTIAEKVSIDKNKRICIGGWRLNHIPLHITGFKRLSSEHVFDKNDLNACTFITDNDKAYFNSLALLTNEFKRYDKEVNLYWSDSSLIHLANCLFKLLAFKDGRLAKLAFENKTYNRILKAFISELWRKDFEDRFSPYLTSFKCNGEVLKSSAMENYHHFYIIDHLLSPLFKEKTSKEDGFYEDFCWKFYFEPFIDKVDLEELHQFDPHFEFPIKMLDKFFSALKRAFKEEFLKLQYKGDPTNKLQTHLLDLLKLTQSLNRKADLNYERERVFIKKFNYFSLRLWRILIKLNYPNITKELKKQEMKAKYYHFLKQT